MNNMLDIKVNDKFQTSRSILSWLNRHGYSPCNSYGSHDYVLEENQVNFLRPTPPTVIFLGIGFPLLRADLFIGCLKNLDGGVWSLEVNGYENLVEMTKLAEKIQNDFAHLVVVNLASEHSKYSG